MQLILSTKYTKERLGRTWALQFYQARYVRLFPTYFMGCLIVLSVALLWPCMQPIPTWNYLRTLGDTPMNLMFKTFLCFSNVTMLFQDVTMFFASHHGEIQWSSNFWESERPLWPGLIIPQAWSLGIELSFYLIAPYLLRLRSRWLLIGTFCGLSLKIVAIRMLHLGDPWTYRFFPFELGYFLAGALACRHRTSTDWILPGKFAKSSAYLLAVAIAGLQVPVHMQTLVYPLGLAFILPAMFRATATDEADRLIGELSYPFYIFHYFALTIASVIARHWWPRLDQAWAGLVLTLVGSTIARFIEVHGVEPWRSKFAETRAERPMLETASPTRETHADGLRSKSPTQK